MKAPRKVYILKNNEYIEITLQEHEALQKTMPGYLDKKFVFLHDCLMEVSESFYLDFYKDKRRQKYLDECAAQYGNITFYFSLNTIIGEKNDGSFIIYRKEISPCTLISTRIGSHCSVTDISTASGKLTRG